MEVQIAELQNELMKVKKTLEEYLSSEKARVDTRVQEFTADLRQLAQDIHQALCQDISHAWCQDIPDPCSRFEMARPYQRRAS